MSRVDYEIWPRDQFVSRHQEPEREAMELLAQYGSAYVLVRVTREVVAAAQGKEKP